MSQTGMIQFLLAGGGKNISINIREQAQQQLAH